jgi:chaperonin GroEL (HSP60 family)
MLTLTCLMCLVTDGLGASVSSMTKVADIEAAEKDKMRAKVQRILDHGINCFVNRQLIYNLPEELFADAGWLQQAVRMGTAVLMPVCRIG